MLARERYVALTRVDAPEFVSAISDEQIVSRHFVQRTDVGSLGLVPRRGGQIALRASYPVSEERTFRLNIERDGWAAYLENRLGQRLGVSCQLTIGSAAVLTDAFWDITRRQMRHLDTKPEKARLHARGVDRLPPRPHARPLSEMGQDRENPDKPAGYILHFSPRTGKTLGTLLEYDFAGAPTLFGYASIDYRYRKGLPA